MTMRSDLRLVAPSGLASTWPAGPQVAAAAVVPGDRVRLAGCWLPVRAVQSGRYASGAPAVVLVFDAGSTWWLPDQSRLLVEREGRLVSVTGGGCS
ncbi:hypothetical protein [Streptomyces sp. SAJ15]|uniref:hypothetical protein n=1 Tax=Streptomyces sp. SAJ15 TaxID=2011095 RepID=UPI001185F536|nr:hypothetical protein [Streptomyces sp. SAJ15]TVL92284.1 hypothetical protein CD790_11250 [Streptomyces sp. SAJ15]